MALSTAQANAFLDTLLGASAWLALSTADPGLDGSGLAEPAGGSYARVDVHAKFAAASGRTKTSNAIVTMPTATAGWGTPLYWVIMDASTAGVMKWKGLITGSGPVNNTDVVSFPSGSLALNFT